MRQRTGRAVAVEATVRRGLRGSSLGLKIGLASAVVALVLMIPALPFAQALRDGRRAADANVRAEKARTSAELVLRRIVDAETGTRGFTLTGDRRFLEPRQVALRALPGELRRLERLVDGDPAAERSARAIAAGFSSYMANYNRPLVSATLRDRRDGVRGVATGEGKRRVDRLRALSRQLDQALDRAAQRRNESQKASDRKVSLLGIAGLGSALLVLLLLGLYLRSAIARPVEQLTQTARRLAEGELSSRVQLGGAREFNDLARSFNDMAASLQSSRGKLVSANAELEAARYEAEHANLAKSEFLSRMSHELRTPLNSIIGFSQLLAEDELRPEQREDVRHVLSAGRHLLGLINEVLDIARVEAGRLSISLEAVDARAAVTEVTDLVRPLAAERQISLSLPEGEGEVWVIADRQRLKQVLLNLLSNAIKYNRVGGSVRVTLDGGAELLGIGVHDTGRGLEPDEIPRVFVPFERLAAAGEEIEGTGLGLALARRMADAMGGRITVHSEVDVGSTFRLELRRDPHPPVAEAMEAIAEEASSAGPAPAAATVLHIEDNSANLRVVERILDQRAGVRLISAIQGRRGLELADQHRPDLILLDLHLPDIQGWDVLRELHAVPRTRDIPVVIVSADATEHQVVRLLQMGARAYLTKPLDVSEFLRTVDDVLSRTVAA